MEGDRTYTKAEVETIGAAIWLELLLISEGWTGLTIDSISPGSVRVTRGDMMTGCKFAHYDDIDEAVGALFVTMTDTP